MKKYGHTLTQAISVPNFWQIWPFMHSLECPKVFGPFRVHDWVPWIQKYNFLKHKKIPHGFSQTLSVPNFRQIWTFMPSLEWPRRFLVHLRSRYESPGPKNLNFQKKRKTHPQGFTQSISVSNFKQIWPFLPSLEYPKTWYTDTQTHTLSGSSSTKLRIVILMTYD